jgi:phospholipid/cholesterol/gamma-HCH transport system permease protein
MVAGRVGSGIAAELGSMVVTEQIAALRALGTDPVRKLVVPRILAGTIMMPVLTVIADAVGIAGGAVISQSQLKVATSIYWNNVIMGLTMDDVWMGLLKPVVLGFAVMSIGCFVGLRTTGGTQGVGRAATMAVVGGSVAVLTADFLITKLMITLLY